MTVRCWVLFIALNHLSPNSRTSATFNSMPVPESKENRVATVLIGADILSDWR